MGLEIILGLSLGYISISAIIENLPVKFKVKRISKSGVLNKKIVATDVSQLSIDECLRFGENNEIVKEFIEILEKEFSDCDLSAFYDNIKNLKIDSQKESFLLNLLDLTSGGTTGGIYSFSDNKIHMSNIPFRRSCLKKAVMFHELLHMASSRKNNKVYVSGFRTVDKSISIGEGLNEGYTELLNCRYFDNGRHAESYYDLQMMALGIESILGQKKMRESYFSNDLKGLIHELEKYTSKEDVITLLVKMDTLLDRKYTSNPKKATLFAREIRTDIANIRLKKLNIQKDTGEISEKEYAEAIYEQELYINGYIIYRKKDDAGNIVKNIIGTGPSLNYGYVEISLNEFERYTNDYYSSHGDKEFNVDEIWKNKQGISTAQIIEVRMRTKKETRERKYDELSIVKNDSSELEEMFVRKNSDSNESKQKNIRS